MPPCDTRKNTVDALIKKGVIDETRKVTNLSEFNRLNQVYSEKAREDYGVQGGLLFDVQTTTVPRNEKRNESTHIIRRVLANLPMFERLDAAVEKAMAERKQAKEQGDYGNNAVIYLDQNQLSLSKVERDSTKNYIVSDKSGRLYVLGDVNTQEQSLRGEDLLSYYEDNEDPSKHLNYTLNPVKIVQDKVMDGVDTHDPIFNITSEQLYSHGFKVIGEFDKNDTDTQRVLGLKSLKSFKTVKPEERSQEELSRIHDVVIPRMNEILKTLGVKTAIMDKLFNQQQEINRLTQLRKDTKDPKAKGDIRKQIKNLQTQGFDKETAAFADIMNRVIQFADNEMSEDNLTEETIHFVVDIVQQKYPGLFKEMYDKIPQFQIYKDTKDTYQDDRRYQTAEGKPDFHALKIEAIGKLLATHVLYPTDAPEDETQASFLRYIWNKFTNFIQNFFGQIDPNQRSAFAEVADRMLHDPTFITKEDAENLSDGGGYAAKKLKTQEDSLKSSAREMKRREAEFEKILPEWTKKGKRPNFKTTEQAFKLFKDLAKDITKQSVEVRKDSEGNPEFEDRYFYKGVQVPERVHTVLEKALGKARGFTNLDKGTERELFREAKMQHGTALHAEIEGIINLYVDPETGFLRDTPLEEVDKVHTTAEVFEYLNRALHARLLSYPEGTRFMTEVPIVNFVDGYAGTADFMALIPSKDGKSIKVDLIDWKSNEIYKRSEWLGTQQADINTSPFDQRFWKSQLELYKRALHYMGVDHFGYTRAIPIATRFVKTIIDKTKPVTELTNIRFDLASVEIGSHDVRRIPTNKKYLIPVSTETEKTGDVKLDELLKKIWGLRDYLQKAPHSGEDAVKYTELERITNAAKELQVTGTAHSLVTVFNNAFTRTLHLLDRDTPFLDNLEQGEYFTDPETDEAVEKYIRELTDAYYFMNVFKDSAAIIRGLYVNQPNTPLNNSVIDGIQDVESNASAIRLRLEERLQSVAGTIGMQFNIGNVNALDFAADSWTKIFTSLYSREEGSIKLFANLKMVTDAVRERKIAREIEQIAGLRDSFLSYIKDKKISRKDALAKLVDKDTGRLISKVSPRFWDTLRIQREVAMEVKDKIVEASKGTRFRSQALVDKLNKEYEDFIRPWLEENVHIDQFLESYKKRRASYIDYLNSTSFNDDPFLDDNAKDAALTKWEKNNDILSYPEALNYKNNSIKVNEEKWFTDEYRELTAKDADGNLINKPLLDLHEYFQSLNIRAIESGMTDDIWKPASFIAQFEKDNIGYKLNQAALNGIKTIKFLTTFVLPFLKNKDELQDTYEEPNTPIDPVTGLPTNYIPVYHKTLDASKKVEPDLFKTFAKWAEHVSTYESLKDFEQRLNLARVVEGLKKSSYELDGKGKPKLDPKDPSNWKEIPKTGDTPDLLEKYINHYVYSKDQDPNISFATRKVLDALYKYTMLKYLALNIPALIGIPLAGAVRRNAILQNYTTQGDMKAAQAIYAGIGDPLSYISAGHVSDLPEKALFLRKMFGTSLYQTRDIASVTLGKEGTKNKHARDPISSIVLAPYGWSHNVIQEPIAIAVFMNTAFVDGKLVNIPTYARELYPEKYEGSISEQQRTNKLIQEKIDELKKQNLFTLVEGEPGKYTVKGLDPNTVAGKRNILRVSNLARALTKDAMGNASPEDVSAAQMNYWARWFLEFKHFLPWQMKTVFGKLRFSQEKQAMEVGRVTALWATMTHQAGLISSGLLLYNLIPGLSTLTRVGGFGGVNTLNAAGPTAKAMARAGRLIYAEQSELLQQRGQDVNFTEAAMIDLYKNTVNGLLKEVHGIMTMGLIMALAGLAAAKNKKKRDWEFAMLERLHFLTWNTLTQTYDPSAMTYLVSHALPVLSSVDDNIKFIGALLGKTFGEIAEPLTRDSPTLHKKAMHAIKSNHPLYEGINEAPGFRQANHYMMAHSKKYSKYLGKPQPKQTW